MFYAGAMFADNLASSFHECDMMLMPRLSCEKLTLNKPLLLKTKACGLFITTNAVVVLILEGILIAHTHHPNQGMTSASFSSNTLPQIVYWKLFLNPPC